MKTFSTICCFLLLSLSAVCQSFEGKVIYRLTYKSKVPALPDAQFTDMMGNMQEYFVKGGNYKSLMNGSLVQWQLYPAKDTLVYNKMASTDAVYWVDARTNEDQVLSAKVNKGVTTILGYLCDELILTCTSGVQKYYFSQKLPLDASLFQNHQYGNWLDYLKNANAVPLKMVVDNEMMVLESTATEVKPMKLDNTVFQLVKGSRLEKMPE